MSYILMQIKQEIKATYRSLLPGDLAGDVLLDSIDVFILKQRYLSYTVLSLSHNPMLQLGTIKYHTQIHIA